MRAKATFIKKILTIGLLLIVIQAALIFYFSSGSSPKPFNEIIEESVNKVPNIDNKRRSQLKIQLAVIDFMTNNQGTPPPNLDVLVPKYFDSVPIDPDTGKPFEYKVDGVKFIIGKPGEGKKSGLSITGPGGVEREISKEEQSLLIASLTNTEETEEGYIYDPTGKRDPFEPFDLSPKEDLSGKTPLERYDIGQLKLTAVLAGFDEPTAIVENSAGKGFTVKKGTKIGPNGGEVVEIFKDKLMIVETNVDFAGERHTKTIEMRLRTKDLNQ